MSTGRCVAVAVILIVGACGGGGEGGGGNEAAEPRGPAAIFALRPVVDESEPPCEGGSGSGEEVDVVPETRDGAAAACLALGPPIVDAADVRTATLGTVASGGQAVSIVLGRTGAANLDDFATRSQGRRLAIMVHGRLVKAPTIRVPYFAGRVEVVGLPDDEATALFEELEVLTGSG